MDSLEGDAVEESEGLVVGVEWLDDDDFVALVCRNLHSLRECFAASHAYQKFGNLDVDADFLIVFLNKSLAKFNQACRVGV